MSDFDRIVRGRDRDIGIVGEIIAAVDQNLRGTSDEEVDATALEMFPGVIDAHVHFNEPGRTEWEGFATGSHAAAAGGTTLVFDMPLNSHPPTIDAASFDVKRHAAEAASTVDFALWGGIVPGNVNELEGLRDRGVIGLKAFMCNSGIDDFPQISVAELKSAMYRAAELDVLVAVHAESEEMTQRLTDRFVSEGRIGIADYLATRPVQAELDAIACAIDLAAETKCKLHIVHVSLGRGVEMVAEARGRGLDVTCETCPHYLLLNQDDALEIGAVAKCAPPLRTSDQQQALWSQIDNVTTIGSDHSPASPHLKEAANFFQVWGGISGCQHLLTLLIDAAQRGRHVSYDQIARLTSLNVAKLFSVREKGGIAVGKHADLTLVDARAEETIRPQSLRYRHRLSPYTGRTLNNRIVRTILRGQTIYWNGKLPARPRGKLVQPQRQ